MLEDLQSMLGLPTIGRVAAPGALGSWAAHAPRGRARHPRIPPPGHSTYTRCTWSICLYCNTSCTYKTACTYTMTYFYSCCYYDVIYTVSLYIYIYITPEALRKLMLTRAKAASSETSSARRMTSLQTWISSCRHVHIGHMYT